MTDLASADIDRLWSQYKDSGSRRARDQLIVHYSPLVKYVAGRVAVGLPQNVDQADLVSYGLFGLIDAIDKFEPERGFKFETYAISRIKGNILDELRAIDWVPRSVRAKARAIERAHAYREAGVDVLFIEGIRSDDDIASIMAEFRGKIPIMANMVEGGDTPLQNAQALQALGFSLVIFPGALVRAFTHMASQFFGTLRRDGTTDAFRERMLDFSQLNEVLGTRKMLELGEKYDAR